MKTAVTSRIKQMLKGKDGSCFPLSLDIHWVSLHLGRGVGWGRRGRCSLYVLCMPLPWWMVWFGLFPPLLLILCVLFPLCCTIGPCSGTQTPQCSSCSQTQNLGICLLFCYSFYYFLATVVLKCWSCCCSYFSPFCWTSSLMFISFC